MDRINLNFINFHFKLLTTLKLNKHIISFCFGSKWINRVENWVSHVWEILMKIQFFYAHNRIKWNKTKQNEYISTVNTYQKSFSLNMKKYWNNKKKTPKSLFFKLPMSNVTIRLFVIFMRNRLKKPLQVNIVWAIISKWKGVKIMHRKIV